MNSLKFLLVLVLVGVALADMADNENSVEDQNEEESLETRRRPNSKFAFLAHLARLEARLRKLEKHRLFLLRGRDGRDGMTGRPGSDGHNGKNGSPGPQGPKGAKGKRGKDGKQGPPGSNGGGVVYTRWGKTVCPRGASRVYKGRMGGEHYTHKGGGVNYLCMTEHPKYLNHMNGWQAAGRVYGTEYEVSQYAHGRTLFGKTLHDHDAPCAVCHVAKRSSKLMIPGTYKCPAGWKREYYGYLMTEYYGHVHPRDFICVDKSPQSVPGSAHNHNGALLYPVKGACGSLPCGPYKNSWDLTCAVCTK